MEILLWHSGSAAHVICLGNLAALKLPLGVQWRIHWQCYSKHILQGLYEPTQTVWTYTDCANLHRLCEPTQTVQTYTDCANLHKLCEPTQTVRTYTDCANLHRLCEPTQTVRTYTDCANLHKLCELTELCRMQESYRIVEMITSCWAVFEPAGLSPKWICC